MKLQAYLAARGETQSGFARRTGIAQRTVNRACGEGSTPSLEVASRIVRATRAAPAPDGGTVMYEDLLVKEDSEPLRAVVR